MGIVEIIIGSLLISTIIGVFVVAGAVINGALSHRD